MFSIFNFSNYQIDNQANDLVKTGAYKSLIRADIQHLPIMYQTVFCKMERIQTRIYSYSYQDLGEPPENYAEACGDYGAIFFVGPDKYSIYYNDIWPDDVKNWVILSLFACIELNMVPIRGLMRFTENMDEIVNDFVYHFLAPDPILKKCGIRSATDIAAACCIPLKNALAKSHNMKKGRFRKDASLDILLAHCFKDFIESYK